MKIRRRVEDGHIKKVEGIRILTSEKGSHWGELIFEYVKDE